MTAATDLRPPAAADISAEDALAEFDRANSPDGLMWRYAAGRVAHFLSRQILTVSGTMSLMLIAAPWVGIFAVLTALIGEAVDCLILRNLPKWRAWGVPEERLRVVSTGSAIFQSLTIASCVTVAWFSTDPGEAAFFCIAYLSGAALNAGIVLPFHPPAAIARLVIYAGTAVGLYAHDVMTSESFKARHGYDLLALLIMMYLVYIFVSYVSTQFRRNAIRSRELLVRQCDLESATRSLKEQEAETHRLSLVARNARDSIMLTDAKGRVTWVNDAFTETNGYTLDDVRGRHPGALLNGPETDPITVSYIATEVAAGRPLRAELLNYTKDGRKIWVETHIVPVAGETSEDAMTIAVERDITRAKEDASRLADAMTRAEAASRAKSEFLATMSHEIRTPMNGIMGMAELLSETRLDTDQTLYADTIHASARGLLTIINDILDLSRMEAGRMTVEYTATDLEACLRELRTMFTPQARQKGLTLTVDIDPKTPRLGRTDAGRLRQILINLIGNALKFTTHGGVWVEVKPIRVAGRAQILIDVIDTGIGIADEKQGEVFDAFRQEDGTISRRFGGTGLGLTISRKLAQLLGGDIKVASIHGDGSCFSLTLDFAPVAATLPRPVAKPVPSPAVISGGTGSILVAEDNHTNRLLMSRFLKDCGYAVRFAEDGQKAVDAALAEPPDLIFMDISMPGMNGLDATRAIRKAPLSRQPVIVALTANAFEDDRKACLAAGMNAFLAKPVRKADLLAHIASLTLDTAAE
ncbi:response regulator [Pseudaestuariivita sp.]|uniref:response regulator n=1 Tax=Pseudaestuariivita sp. TaxID=2211669 RepID=UPI004057EFF0